jgi:hypothetical protein
MGRQIFAGELPRRWSSLLAGTAGFLAVGALTVGCSDMNFSSTPANTNPNAPVSAGQSVTDRFTQGFTQNKLDILVVVDDSNSMEDDQKKMGSRISSFINTLSDVDWQIAITNTDVSNGPYGLKGSFLPVDGAGTYVLTPSTPDYSNKFLKTVVRPQSYLCNPECPSGDEQPLRAMIQSMEKRDSDNAGFFRPGADLSVLVLSDEDEKSTGGSNATRGDEVVGTFRSIWGDSKNLSVFGMIIVPGDVRCLAEQGGGSAVAFGARVHSLAQMTGGSTGSICDRDFGPALARIGQRVKRLLEFVQLRAKPDVSTIKISFSPDHKTNYRVVEKRIYFENPPPVGTQISVDYKATEGSSGVN